MLIYYISVQKSCNYANCYKYFLNIAARGKKNLHCGQETHHLKTYARD